MSMTPPSNPTAKLSAILKIAAKYAITDEVFMVAVRGFWTSMGRPGNDRGIYDDALFLVTPTSINSYIFNTDASRVRKGRGKSEGTKGMAMLKAGRVWRFKPGMHRNAYMAWVQAESFTVVRDGVDGDYEDTGQFGIHLHRGGNTTTSSLGCQTVLPSQWPEFYRHSTAAMKAYSQKNIPYILVTVEEMSEILK